MTRQDLFEAKAQRDTALNQVLGHAGSYVDAASVLICALSGEVTGEDVRLLVERQIGPPHHHNVWGAIINHALRRGYLQATDRSSHMKTPKSHARKTPVYRALGDKI